MEPLIGSVQKGTVSFTIIIMQLHRTIFGLEKMLIPKLLPYCKYRSNTLLIQLCSAHIDCIHHPVDVQYNGGIMEFDIMEATVVCHWYMLQHSR